MSVEAGQLLERLTPPQYPTFTDDHNLVDLREAINRDLVYLNRLDDSKSFNYGPDVYTVKQLKESLNDFLAAMKHSEGDIDLLNNHIRRNYAVYAYRGNDSPDAVTFTGYFVPILRGSLSNDDTYRYPLYRPPEELNKVMPFLTRQEIDAGALVGRGLELLYVNDRVELFFLHVQGSGVIELDTGEVLYVGYAGTNGHDYRSIGKLLLEENKMDNKSVSMQGIKAYLRENPQEIDRVLAHNPSYVFFKTTQEIAICASNVPLVAGRAIATDLRIYPQGALAYVSTKKAVLDKAGRITGYRPLTRFVLNQDTGKAIVGPTRVDFFWGMGKYAEIQAGTMRQSGKLYFLVRKQPPKEPQKKIKPLKHSNKTTISTAKQK
ncbi:MltA domain-containing protein [Candidatus Magnetobacterium bavaricum]|uniref:peptidoglycan lytic exotransglycosylase n=1 Tax=Candidatus Magnetobacterium bavaricum TaxID=29290 RepID=A0A0F3GRD1_9BACT|nr:MltA domain-containing protein [Candidatus Magnetobacterium bavaricum]